MSRAAWILACAIFVAWTGVILYQVGVKAGRTQAREGVACFHVTHETENDDDRDLCVSPGDEFTSTHTFTLDAGGVHAEAKRKITLKFYDVRSEGTGWVTNPPKTRVIEPRPGADL